MSLIKIYKALCKEPIDETKIKKWANSFFCSDSVLDICIPPDDHIELSKLMLRLLNAKDGCLVHPQAVTANVISKLDADVFYLASCKDEEHTIAFDILADIWGINAKFVDGNIPFEKAKYVYFENPEVESPRIWEYLIQTIENNANGVFLMRDTELFEFKKKIAGMREPSTPSLILSESISHIFFIDYSWAIVLVQKEKKEKGIVTLINGTDFKTINAERILNDFANNKRSYKLKIEEFNKPDFSFRLNRILQKKNREEFGNRKDVIQIGKLIDSSNIDIYGKPETNRIIRNTYIQDFSVFSPFCTIYDNELISISEQEAAGYEHKLLLVNLRSRKQFQPKILVFDKIGNTKFLLGKIFAYQVNEELVDIQYLVKEMNEDYFIDQLFPTETLEAVRLCDFVNCYLKMPKSDNTRTPVERQRLLLDADKSSFINKILQNYNYDLGKIVSGEKAGWLKDGSTLLEGKYSVVTRLGSGGFGKTYKAIRKNEDGSKTIVAIKEFFDHKLQRREKGSNNVLHLSNDIENITVVRNKFFTEAEKIMSFADCENIIKVYDVFDENNTSYYSMEFIDGDNLHNHVMKMKKLDEGEAVRIIKGVANALKRMHCERMLHMDVKPKNIMISKEGRVVLIDFGGAHKYNTSPHDNSTLARIGSPGFTPPEPVSSVRFSPAYDIYSLGATLYYMLTGIIYNIHSEDSQRGKNGNHTVQFTWINGVSEETNKCMEKSLAYLSKDRQKNIDEFLEMLPS